MIAPVFSGQSGIRRHQEDRSWVHMGARGHIGADSVVPPARVKGARRTAVFSLLGQFADPGQGQYTVHSS